MERFSSISFYRMIELKLKGRVLSAKLNFLINCRGNKVFKITQLLGCKTNQGRFTHQIRQRVCAFKNCFYDNRAAGGKNDV